MYRSIEKWQVRLIFFLMKFPSGAEFDFLAKPGMVQARLNRAQLVAETNPMIGLFPRQRYRNDICFLIPSFAIWLLAGPLSEAQNLFSIAAKTGDTVPGAPAGVTFGNSFTSPLINRAGQRAFTAALEGSSVTSTNQRGVWMESSGALALVARLGDEAPGTSGGAYFSLLRSPLINDTGGIVFSADLSGVGTASTNNTGIWAGGQASPGLLARAGKPAPGTEAGVFFSSSFGPLAINLQGKVTFPAGLTGTGVTASNDSGIWTGNTSSLTLVARGGSPAPGLSTGAVFRTLINTVPVLNSAGRTAFQAGLAGTGISNSNDTSVWSEGTGSLALVAQEGSQAPGTSADVNFNFFNTMVSFNEAGQVAFQAGLTGTEVNITNDSGVWSKGSGSLALVARKGSPAAGTPADVYFGAVRPPLINHAGKTAFTADLVGSGVTTTDDGGVWSEGAGTLALVARKGDQAPGAPAGVNFSGFNSTVTMNGAGQTAFSGNLTGAGVTNSNDFGIWAVDPFGQLVKIARSGDEFSPASNDARTIESAGLLTGSGEEDGKASSFNDRGQLAFQLTFTNSTAAVGSLLVGGPVRLSAAKPLLGPAISNAYGDPSPLALTNNSSNCTQTSFIETSLGADNNAGYAAFANINTNFNVSILLRVSTSNTTLVPLENYLQAAGASGGHFSVTNSHPLLSTYHCDLLLTFASGSFATTETFYWNFADFRDASITSLGMFQVPDTHGTPMACDITFNIAADSATHLTLTGADSDGDALAFAVTSLPSHGLVTGFNPSSGSFTYTPAHGFYGADALTFRASDGATTSAMATASINVMAPADTEGDGMPDAWEIAHGLVPSVNDADLDLDGDGMTNLVEYQANTDPNDPNSVLRITSASVMGNGHCVINWNSAGGTRYRIQYSNGDSSGSVNNVFTDVVRSIRLEMDPAAVGSASTMTFTDDLSLTGGAPSQGVRYFRIRVVP